MIGDRRQQARFQSDFYRDSFYKILRALIVADIFIVCLVILIIYLVLVHPVTHYYATTLSGQIIPMSPAS